MTRMEHETNNEGSGFLNNDFLDQQADGYAAGYAAGFAAGAASATGAGVIVVAGTVITPVTYESFGSVVALT